MAKREQDTGRDFSYHDRKPQSMTEQQEFLVSSLPGVGVTHARSLLTHFGSIKKLVDADLEKLTEVEGVGKKIAERIINLVKEEYKKL